MHISLSLLRNSVWQAKELCSQASFKPCLWHFTGYSMVKKHPTSFHLTSTDGSSSPAKGAQRSWQLRSMTGFNIEVFSSLHYLTAVATGLPVSTLITFLAITNIKLLVCGRVSHLQRAMMLVPHFTRQPKPSGRTQNSLPRLGHPPSPSPNPVWATTTSSRVSSPQGTCGMSCAGRAGTCAWAGDGGNSLGSPARNVYGLH